MVKRSKEMVTNSKKPKRSSKIVGDEDNLPVSMPASSPVSSGGNGNSNSPEVYSVDAMQMENVIQVPLKETVQDVHSHLSTNPEKKSLLKKLKRGSRVASQEPGLLNPIEIPANGVPGGNGGSNSPYPKAVASIPLENDIPRPPKEKTQDLALEQPMNQVSLRYYVDLFMSCIWIVLAYIVAGGGLGYLSTKVLPKAYQTTSTILVSQGLGQSANYDTIWTGEQLASTYADMVNNPEILSEVSSQIGSGISPAELSQSITTSPVVNSPLIEITVEYSDPATTVKIADTLVDVFKSQIENSQVDSATSQDDQMQLQLQQLESDITALQEKIREETLQLYNQRLDTINTAITELGTDSSPTYKPLEYNLLLQYQNELVSLTAKGPILDSQDFQSSQDAVQLDQKQRLYYSLLQSYQNMQVSRMQNTVKVIQINPPAYPTSPVRPKLFMNLVLGVTAGIILSVLFIFIEDIKRNPKRKYP